MALTLQNYFNDFDEKFMKTINFED